MRLHNRIGSRLSVHFRKADIRGKFLAALTFFSFFATLFVHSSNGQEKATPTALEIHRWTKQLAADDWILQSVALEQLGNWKVKQAVPEIRHIFEKGKSSWLKGQAMLTLAKIQGKEMIPTAQRATKEKDPVLRKAALQTLDLVGGKTSAPVARELLKDRDTSVRAMAAALYASQFPEEAWPTVEKLTPPDKSDISSDLMRALALVGSEEAFARLETLFHAPEGNKRRGRDVIQALAVADEEGIPLLARLTVQYGPNQSEFQLGQKLLGRRNKADLAVPLKDMLLAEETRFQASAASLMAKVCPTKELGDLLANSWIKRDDIPQEAIREGLVALSKIDPLRYQEFFSRHLRSEDPDTRAMAVRCRGLIPDKDLFEVFRSYVHDENAGVAQAALESLRRAPLDSRPSEGLLAYLTESFRSPEGSVLLRSEEHT
ncbi:MAG: HEAT repeat domain-containing protein, partial [Opitutales bacterium]